MFLELVFISSILALLFAGYLTRKVNSQDPGTEKMKDIARAIQEGSMAFLRREYRTLFIFVLAVTIILGLLFNAFVSLSYVVGSIASALAGYIGMRIATQSNVRAACAARTSFSRALKIAFSGGSVMGFVVVGLGLIGLLAIFVLLYSATPDPEILIAYGFGASSIALFLRVGGGIFTKSADVGADLVGKVEKGIPEDDPRNPAVIADNVGDNVGDIAGMGSDLFESYVSAILAAMILGVLVFGQNGLIYPMLLAGVGIIASIIGSLFVSSSKEPKTFQEETATARGALNRGVIISNVLMIIVAYIVTIYVLNDLGVFLALLSGLLAGFLIGKTTEYYTSDKRGPVQGIVKSSQTGPATNIIEGLSVGMMSTVIPIILVSLATLISFYYAGLFGIAIASVGMLANLAILLSIDSYGPIADNAAGIAEMAGLGKVVREKTEALDSVGNTTAAVGKGFAISSAALSSLAWLATYFEVAGLQVINIIDPSVIVGLMIGSMLAFLFSALTMKAVSAGAFEIINEVRRQFKEIKGIMSGKARPDYARCVDITTARAIRQMIIPGLIVIAAPLILGLTLGAASVGGLLAGALMTGFLFAIMMANSGGAWDNAKKYIEAGHLGGKGSPAHKASVIGDTVGDPFKDTSGPSLNILIKLIGKVALMFATFFAVASIL
jgi:K(+)-stimulated pyrophosphate-energized sodium pump